MGRRGGRFRIWLLISVLLALCGAPCVASVIQVEPGHTLTQLVDSCNPLDPSQAQLEFICQQGNNMGIESVGVDPASGTLYIQLADPGAPSFDSCVFGVSPGGVVTLINPSTGFGINERGTDLHYDPATGLLVTENDNAFEIATVNPVGGLTGTYAADPGLFQGGTFGMDFSNGAGGSIVPPGNIVFVSDVSANGIYSTPVGGPVTQHVVPPDPGDDMYNQPDGDWVHVPDGPSPLTAYQPFPPHLATPSGTNLNIVGMFNNAGLPFEFGTRATGCDNTGELYVSYSGSLGGSGIFRVDEPLASETLLATIGAFCSPPAPTATQCFSDADCAVFAGSTCGEEEGLQDLIVGPSTAGAGQSLFFTIHEPGTACEEVWELTLPECEEVVEEPCETTLYGAANEAGQGPGTLYTINPFNGAPIPVGPINFNSVGGIDFHPQTGVLYGVGKRPADNASVLITINPNNGAGTEVGPTNVGLFGFGENVSDISFRNGDGVLYGFVEGGDAVVTFNLNTGQANFIGASAPQGCCGSGITFDWFDELFHQDETALHTLDQGNGTANPVAPTSFLGFPPPVNFFRPNALDTDPTSDLTYASVNDGGGGSGPNYLATLNRTTGDLAFIGQTVPGLDALTWQATCDDNDPCTIDICKHCEEKQNRVPPIEVLTVDCDPFNGGPFNFTMGEALLNVDLGGDFLVTEVTPAVFRSMTAAQLAAFNLIAVQNHISKLGDNCNPGAGNGLGTTWHNVIGVNTGGRVVLSSHDPVRFHHGFGPSPPQFPPGPGTAPYGADELIRQAALWAGTGTQTGLLIFNDSPQFSGGVGWNNPELNLPPVWGIADVSQEPLGGIWDGGYTQILGAFVPHSVYSGAGIAGGVPLSDLRFDVNSISSFAANIGDASYHSVFDNFNPVIFQPSEVVVNAGTVDVGGLCPGCSLVPAPGPDGLVITLIREEERNGECPHECNLFGSAYNAQGGQFAPATLYQLDPNTGAALPIGPIGLGNVGGIDFHPQTGVLYGVGLSPAAGIPTLVTINPATGQGSPVGPLVNTPIQVGGHFDLSFDATGTLYLTAFGPVGGCPIFLYTINLVTGMATPVGGPLGGPAASCAPGNALGFDNTGTLFHGNQDFGPFGPDGTEWIVDPILGTSVPVNPLTYVGFPGLQNPRTNAMDNDPCSRQMYVSVNDGQGGTGPNYLATLATATGTVNLVGPTVEGLDAIAWQEDSAGSICCHIPAPDTDGDGLCDPIDPCPTSPNPGGGNVSVFGQTVLAVTNNDFAWPAVIPYQQVTGFFTLASTVYPYPFGPFSVGVGNNFNDPLPPPPSPVPRAGNGFWYLFKPDCPRASWTSGGPRECDGPPTNPNPCAAGDRDVFLP